MKVYQLIKLLGEISHYGANEEVYLHDGDKDYPFHHALDSYIGPGGKSEKIIVFVSEKHKDYYGE